MAVAKGLPRMGDNMDLSQILPIAAKYALPALYALVVFLIGKWIAGRVFAGAERGFNRSPNADPSLSRFFASLLKYIVLFVAIMAALTVLGVDTSSFSAAILGMGAAMAFVLQGSLSNIAAGVMLMIFRPMKIGDEVEIGGTSGVVTDIQLTATRLKSADNVEKIVSNSNVWGGTIRNNTSLGKRRLDMVFGVDYGADIDKAIKVLTETASKHDLVLETPAPWAKVVNLNESSVDLELRAWCKASDYKGLKVSISQPVKAAFDKAGIGIPYPHGIKISKSVKTSKARDRIARLKSIKNS